MMHLQQQQQQQQQTQLLTVLHLAQFCQQAGQQQQQQLWMTRCPQVSLHQLRLAPAPRPALHHTPFQQQQQDLLLQVSRLAVTTV
jgi:hypothetical protein